MRLLLDESLPQGLRHHFPGHDVVTVPYRGWASKRNGELLQLASAEFDVFLTVDRNLEHQQNLAQYDLAVVVLVGTSSRLADLAPLAARVLALLPAVRPGRAYRVSG